jgi:pyruvate ferredoxin oxidoreductase delta subunit
MEGTDSDMVKPNDGWKDIPRGGLILEAGNARAYETGGWRALRPLWDQEACIQCMTCWVYCPDSSIMVEDGIMVGIDLVHCKGCGVCVQVCPKKLESHVYTKKEGKVIQMVEESEFRS